MKYLPLLLLLACTNTSTGTQAVENKNIMTAEELAAYTRGLPELPVQARGWCVEPKIKVCHDGIYHSKEAIDFAFEYVDSSLFNLDIEFIDCPNPCDVPEDTILIGGPHCILKRGRNDVGMTKWRADASTMCLQGVKIELTVHSLHALVHEAGHAAGYDHAAKVGHVMFPALDYGGWNNEGLR